MDSFIYIFITTKTRNRREYIILAPPKSTVKLRHCTQQKNVKDGLWSQSLLSKTSLQHQNTLSLSNVVVINFLGIDLSDNRLHGVCNRL